MAKRFDVELRRTTVEVARVVVEARTEREAAFRAAQQVKPEDFQPKSIATDLAEVLWRDGGE